MGKGLVDKNYLATLLTCGDVVAVAVSGGKDSVALLHYLKTNEKELGITVKAVNVEHGIRGAESLSDSEFVKKMCAGMVVPLKCFSGDAVKLKEEKGLTAEEAARELRYGFFKQAVDCGFCDHVATAHHQSDNAETVLLRIFRGTGIDGLSGIKEVSGRVIRPLLHTSKADVDEYISANGLEFVTDSTNLSDEADRNFLRNVLLPLAKTRFPSVENGLLRLSDNAKACSEYIGAHATNVKKQGESVLVYEAADKISLVYAFKKAFSMLGVNADVEKRHFDLLVELFEKQAGAVLDMPHGVKAARERDCVRLYAADEPWTGEVTFGAGELQTPMGTVVVRPKEDGDAVYFDIDLMPEGSVVRTRKNGDYIQKFGGGRKSLSDFLNDKKVPLYLKDRLLVVASGSEILAVIGVDVSKSVAVSEQSKNVFTIILK